HHVAARRPGQAHEVLVPAEGELTEAEAAVAEFAGLAGLHVEGGAFGHLRPFALTPFAGRSRPSARWCRPPGSSGGGSPPGARRWQTCTCSNGFDIEATSKMLEKA